MPTWSTMARPATAWTRPELEALTVEELRSIARDADVHPKAQTKAAMVAAILGE
jgi:hypothetical protein